MNEKIKIQEIWKDIPDWVGLYQISNLGRVKSLERETHYKANWGIHKSKEMILKQAIRNYYYVTLQKQGRIKMGIVHRLMATAFIPNPENKREVNHIDGNKLNNSLNNLEWVTVSENRLHAFRIGLQISKKGEERHNAILTEEIVKQIRSKYSYRKYTMPMLASEYGVSIGAIQSVLSRVSWSHI